MPADTLSDQLRFFLRMQPSLGALARAARVNPCQLYRFLNGDRGISLATADRLAKALGFCLRADNRPG
jgi:plasmid maintenance system antidote protein VapI